MLAEDCGSHSGYHALTNSRPEIATLTHAQWTVSWDGGQVGAHVTRTAEVVLKPEHDVSYEVMPTEVNLVEQVQKPLLATPKNAQLIA